MCKNPTGYKKLKDGTWDCDLLNDMMFSFWLIKEIDAGHPQKEALKEVGIAYECNCPQFNHYHVCKHSLCVGLWQSKVEVPLRFSTETVAKRKAPAGASLSKRSRCMVID